MQGRESPPCTARQTVERLVGAYADLVLRLSYARLGSVHDAQDVCQTVFLKLLQLKDTGKANFADAEHEKAWVIRVTINTCTDLLRSGWRTKVVPLESTQRPGGETGRTAEQPYGNDDADAHDGPAPAVEQTQPGGDPAQGSRVLEAVNELPAALRASIYLHYFEGYSTDEIAQLTGDTPDTVRKHLSRGRAKLRDALEGEGL